MSNRRFIIPSLLAAGFVCNDAKALLMDQEISRNDIAPLIDVFRIQSPAQLAAHRSHQSHGSHGSHRSSSTGYSASPRPLPAPPPARNHDSTPPSTVLPSSPAIATPPPATLLTKPKTDWSTSAKSAPSAADAEQFIEVLKRIQASLYVRGYFTGEVNGAMGPETRSALSKFQMDYKLKVTGTVTPEILNAFNIAPE